MSRFWDAATDQAGREFGHRHYRWFVTARAFRYVAPVASTLIIIAAVVVAVMWIYSAVDPDWAQIRGWATASATLLAFWVTGALLGILLAVLLILLARRAWWSWWNLSRPTWWRRY